MDAAGNAEADMTAYRVWVAGRLPDGVTHVLEELGAGTPERVGSMSMLEVVDQAALLGVLDRLHCLGLVIGKVDRAD
jgi:hypothetical protein